ncbi:iron-containing alcohol dehydrogenase, partial [Akkermansiaceae bacterium]|nr:iron-containing alcohol dehydrogenase [Akkermansiaceae bacterium]
MQTLLHGPGSLAELPKYVSGKVLIVTDAGIVSAGHVARATALLNEVTIYDAVSENPTESDVGACAEFARSVN